MNARILWICCCLIIASPPAGLSEKRLEKYPASLPPETMSSFNGDIHPLNFDDPGIEETTFDETPLSSSVRLSGRVDLSINTLRTEYLLNPENEITHFPRKNATTILDGEWNVDLTTTLSLRSRLATEYRRSEDRDDFNGYFLEGYLQWMNDRRTVVLDVGKVKTHWGSAYAWNPVNALIPLHPDTTSDMEKDNEGIGMARLEVAMDSITTTLILASLENTSTEERGHRQSAILLSLNLEPWELTLTRSTVDGTPPTTGASFTGLLSDALELHGECTQSAQRDRPTVHNTAEGVQMGSIYLPARFEYLDDGKDSTYHKIVLGGQYTFENNINIILELYQTSHGYSDEEWRLIKNGLKEAKRENAWNNSQPPFTTPRGNPYRGFIQNTLKAISNGELRRHYLFFRFTNGESVDLWEAEQLLILNLDDRSSLAQFSLRKTWLDSITSEIGITLFTGDTYSEFGLNPFSKRATLTTEVVF